MDTRQNKLIRLASVARDIVENNNAETWTGIVAISKAQLYNLTAALSDISDTPEQDTEPRATSFDCGYEPYESWMDEQYG